MMEYLLWTLLRVSAVLALALVAVALTRRRSAALRHRILSVAVICALAMPCLEWVAPAWELPVPGTWSEAAATSVSVVTASETTEADLAKAPAGHDAAYLVRVGALFAWLAGVLVASGVIGTGSLRLRRLSKASRPMPAGVWTESALAISKRYGLDRQVRLLEGADSGHLMTWGLLRPTVLLPSRAQDWRADQARAVLSHELAHVRRQDWLWQLAGELLRIIWWFNPLVWLACRRLREESERASDDLAINTGIDSHEYAACLVDLARLLHIRRPLPALAFAQLSPSGFGRRIEAMLNPGADRGGVMLRDHAMLAGVFVAASLVAAGCGASARTVSLQVPENAASVFGTVSDQTGALVPGVELRLSSLGAPGADDEANEVTRISNEAGAFRFDEGIGSGSYRLTARLPGFRIAERIINLTGNEAVEANLMLEVAGVATDVQITGVRPPIARTENPPVAEPRPPEPLRIGGNVAQGNLVLRVEPEYSEELREAGVEGTVTVEATIGVGGEPEEIVAVSGPAGLRRAAVEAVRQWRYTPYLLNRSPVAVRTTITMRFSLEDSN